MKPEKELDQPGNPAAHKRIWGGLILVLVAAIGAGTWSVVRGRATAPLPTADRPARLPVHGSVPDFSLLERSYRRVERSDLLGKVWIVNFIYTHCPDTCPLQSAEMAKLQADLASETDVRLVSITVDPAHDTPEVLARYARRFAADPVRWLFLTGDRAAIYRFAMEGLRLPVLVPGGRAKPPGRGITRPEGLEAKRSHVGEEASEWIAGAPTSSELFSWIPEPPPAMAHHETSSAAILHSSRFVLIDRKVQVRGYYESRDSESLRRLREDVKVLLQEE